jgi:hypothetical protein
MERLTEKCGDRWIPRQNIRNNGHDKCMAKLAEYEDAEEQGLLIRRIKKWERMINPYGELEGFICECGYSDTSASKYCPSCGSKMVYGWKSDTIEAAEEALKGVKIGE